MYQMRVQIPVCEGTIFRGKGMLGHARRHSAVSSAKMAEPIEMPFGLGSMCYTGGSTLSTLGEYD